MSDKYDPDKPAITGRQYQEELQAFMNDKEETLDVVADFVVRLIHRLEDEREESVDRMDEALIASGARAKALEQENAELKQRLDSQSPEVSYDH